MDKSDEQAKRRLEEVVKKVLTFDSEEDKMDWQIWVLQMDWLDKLDEAQARYSEDYMAKSNEYVKGST